MNESDAGGPFHYLQSSEKKKQERKAWIKATLAESSIPVPDEIHDAILDLFVTDAIEVLRAHPGFDLQDKIRSLRMTYELFKQASSDLMTALDVFDQFSRRPEFNYRSHKNEFAAIERRIRKEIFALSTLAHSLQDHCRRLRSDWEPLDVTEQLALRFGSDGLHDFVCGLRSVLHHQSLWRRTGLSLSS